MTIIFTKHVVERIQQCKVLDRKDLTMKKIYPWTKMVTDGHRCQNRFMALEKS